MQRAFTVIGLLGPTVTPALAELRLPVVISDNMVLQQQQANPVWGWAQPGEEMTVTIAGHSVRGKARADGRWQVTLPTLPARSEPAETRRFILRPRSSKEIPCWLAAVRWTSPSPSVSPGATLRFRTSLIATACPHRFSEQTRPYRPTARIVEENERPNHSFGELQVMMLS